MMLLLEKLSDNYHPRCYVVGHDDHRSRFKVHEYEKRRDGIFEKDVTRIYLLNIPLLTIIVFCIRDSQST